MENKYDELLIQGLTKLMDLEFSNISGDKDINYIFSDKYVKNKEKLIKNLGKSYWKFVNTVAKKVAVVIVTLIIAVSSLMTVDAFKDKMINLVYKIYESFSEVISSSKNSNQIISRYYSTTYIPAKYKLLLFNNDSNRRLYILWTDTKDQHITFTQTVLSDSNKFDSEDSILKETTINDTPCLICKTNTDYFCYWEFDGYRFELVYPVDLGEEFMSEVVGNLVEIDPEELEN